MQVKSSAAMDMTEGAPWKHIIRFSLPLLAGSLVQQLYQTVDTIVVGNFSGENALSAVGTTGSFTFLFLAIAIGLSSGNSVIAAQHYGAKNITKLRQTASTGIILLLFLGILISITGFLAARPAFTFLVRVPAEILDLTLVYFRIYAIGLIFQYGYNILAAILRAIGDSASLLYILLITAVMNISLDLLFVAGFHWGVAGAAIATDISQASACGAAYIYMVKKYPVFHFKRNEHLWDSLIARQTVIVGFPIALQLIIFNIGMTFIQRAVNGFGQAMTASFTVGQRIESYLTLPCTSFQTALATYTGQNIGARKTERVRFGVRQTLLISLLITIGISGIIWIFSNNIISLFALNAPAAEYCLAHLHTISLINLLLAVYVPIFGVLQATNHSSIPMIVAIVAVSTRVSVTYLFRFSYVFGHEIIWWNGIFGFSLAFVITWTFYLSGQWKKNSLMSFSA